MLEQLIAFVIALILDQFLVVLAAAQDHGHLITHQVVNLQIADIEHQLCSDLGELANFLVFFTFWVCTASLNSISAPQLAVHEIEFVN